MRFLNKGTFKHLAPEIYNELKETFSLVDHEEDKKHEKITSIIVQNFKDKQTNILQENIVRAGFIRGFLG